MQVIDEHRLVFRLNNNVIRNFPLTFGKGLKGAVKLVPVEILLLVVSLLTSLIVLWYTRDRVVRDPDVEDFADPNYVNPY